MRIIDIPVGEWLGKSVKNSRNSLGFVMGIELVNPLDYKPAYWINVRWSQGLEAGEMHSYLSEGAAKHIELCDEF